MQTVGFLSEFLEFILQGQAGPPKNQKSITQFFKTTNVNNSQKSPEKTPILPSKCDDKPVKRKATSPICIETPKPVESCLSANKDSNKKLKCESLNCKPFKKSPGKENGIKKDNKVLHDFDRLLFPDDVEKKGNNDVNTNACNPKKDRCPLVPCVVSNIGEDILILDDDYDEIDSKSNDKIQCQGKFSPNFYDLNEEDSFEMNKTFLNGKNNELKCSHKAISQTKSSFSVMIIINICLQQIDNHKKKIFAGTPKKSSSVKSINSPLKIHKSTEKCGKALEFSDQDVDCMFGDDWAENMNEVCIRI